MSDGATTGVSENGCPPGDSLPGVIHTSDLLTDCLSLTRLGLAELALEL
jgi:hypothetical protein